MSVLLVRIHINSHTDTNWHFQNYFMQKVYSFYILHSWKQDKSLLLLPVKAEMNISVPEMNISVPGIGRKNSLFKIFPAAKLGKI